MILISLKWGIMLSQSITFPPMGNLPFRLVGAHISCHSSLMSWIHSSFFLFSLYFTSHCFTIFIGRQFPNYRCIYNSSDWFKPYGIIILIFRMWRDSFWRRIFPLLPPRGFGGTVSSPKNFRVFQSPLWWSSICFATELFLSLFVFARTFSNTLFFNSQIVLPTYLSGHGHSIR